MRNTPRAKWFGIALLVGALFVAQTAAQAHLEFDDSHAIGESCVFCVGLADYSGANVGLPNSFAVAIQSVGKADFSIYFFTEPQFAPWFARGPPVTS